MTTGSAQQHQKEHENMTLTVAMAVGAGVARMMPLQTTQQKLRRVAHQGP
jgi:hypothetical protein